MKTKKPKKTRLTKNMKVRLAYQMPEIIDCIKILYTLHMDIKAKKFTVAEYTIGENKYSLKFEKVK